MRKQNRSIIDFRMVLAAGLVLGTSQGACDLEMPAEPQVADIGPSASAAAADSTAAADQFGGLAPIGAYNSAATADSAAALAGPVRPPGSLPPGAFICVRTPSSRSLGPGPLIVVDGTIMNTFTCDANSTNCRSTTADLDTEDIQSIEVVKSQAALDRFGEEARGGVIVITTNRSGR